MNKNKIYTKIKLEKIIIKDLIKQNKINSNNNFSSNSSNKININNSHNYSNNINKITINNSHKNLSYQISNNFNRVLLIIM
jgi:hypothetical protein